MLDAPDDHNIDGLEPELDRARRTSLVAHGVVVKLKEIGLPESLDAELSSVCTDLGDLWSANAALAERLEVLVESASDWEAVGDLLVDIRANVDHIAWHLKSVRKPLAKITRHAYQRAGAAENDGGRE